MAVGAGLASQLMFAAETTVGTAVTPTTAVEYNSESLTLEKNIVQGSGLRGGGLFARSTRRAYTTRSVGGDIELDVVTEGMGTLFEHMLGTAASGVYTPGPLTGKSLTIQKGVPTTAGVVVPFTYNGCKITSWELACEVGGILTLTLTIDGWSETTATGLATPTYSGTARVFHFAHGALVLGGTVSTTGGVASLAGGTAVAAVTGATITGETPMANERFFFGAAGQKAEQVENDWRTIGGSLDAEFTSAAAIHTAFAADTETALKLTFTEPTSAKVLEVLIPSIRFDGSTPTVGGPDLVTIGADFTGHQDATGNAAVQIRYV